MSGHWTLPAALGIGGPELVAFVGGGGKSSLMFALAAALPGRVVITTTTRIFAAQMRLAPAVVYAGDLAPLGPLLARHGRCLVVGHVDGDKAHGVDLDLPARLLARPDVDFVLVEADGSRMRPAKAPADHEPVIPPGTTLVVPVAGLDALEKPLDEVVHRPEQARALLVGATAGESLAADGALTPAGLARLLTHPQGGLKGVPDGARAVVWLNKVEGEGRLEQGRAAARLILRQPRVSRVVLGEARVAAPVREVARRVTGVVLAAGESRRMGTNKLLLPWGETTVLGRTLANVGAAAMHDVLLITGHERERVEAMAGRAWDATRAEEPASGSGEQLPMLFNRDYANGMLTSVQAAVRALPASAEAILVMLGDQPMVTTDTIDRLLHAYAATPAGLVAPYYAGRRGNPVIIDRRYFDELLALPADAAPRALLARHTDDLLAVAVEDEAVLIDLDRPEEYEHRRPA
ncbi:MAG: putative selenium-dependent hydroxylase accessory protein YqeC [Anaerolineae bacterium]|nr:putative selenium-dependent hydroxylase accessory protein YqeC [Anaerolineae bacterium]